MSAGEIRRPLSQNERRVKEWFMLRGLGADPTMEQVLVALLDANISLEERVRELNGQIRAVRARLP